MVCGMWMPQPILVRRNFSSFFNFLPFSVHLCILFWIAQGGTVSPDLMNITSDISSWLTNTLYPHHLHSIGRESWGRFCISVSGSSGLASQSRPLSLPDHSMGLFITSSVFITEKLSGSFLYVERHSEQKHSTLLFRSGISFWVCLSSSSPAQ